MLAIIIGLVLTLAVVGTSAALAVENARALARASRTQDIRALVTQLVEDVTDAETGQRGYLLTDKPSYLDPYEHGSRAAPVVLDSLEAEVSDDPASAPVIARLRVLVPAKLAELAHTVALMRADRRAEAMDTVQSDIGEAAMREIRVLTGQLAARQQAILAERLRAVEAGGRMIVGIDALGLLLLLLIAGAITWSTRRAVAVLRAAQGELAGANAELGAMNEKLEQKVAQRTADLTAANDEIQRFAYIVSHDLRAPLVNIMGFTGELENATRVIGGHFERQAAREGQALPEDVTIAANEDLPEAIRFIKVSTAKMDRLIAAILKLSREGRRVMAPERIEMVSLLQGIADSLQHQSVAVGAQIEVRPVPNLFADRLMLEQVFSNLLENALKYLMQGRPGRVVVSGYRLGGMLVYEVSDNGRGIAARDHDRVFELFRRAGDQRVPGEGIGLAHVRALLRRMGGTIGCESREGVGSTFRVTLPVMTHQAGVMQQVGEGA
jgi:signal transduction histidine kinase